MRRREFITLLGGAAAAWPLAARAEQTGKVYRIGYITVPWAPKRAGLRNVYDERGKLRIPLEGSLQNPAWSPDGKVIVFTRFRSALAEWLY
jgi:hypothetical protein